jgi:hypothetical protein
MTFDDFKPNTDESEHSECLSSFYPIQIDFTACQHNSVTFTRSAVATTRTNLYTSIVKQRERKVNNRAGQKDKFK